MSTPSPLRYTDLINSIEIVEILQQTPNIKNGQILEGLAEKYKSLTSARLTRILVEMQQSGAIISKRQGGYSGTLWRLTPVGQKVLETMQQSGEAWTWKQFVREIHHHEGVRRTTFAGPLTVRKVS